MRTSGSQFQLLVEFMERNGDLSKPATTGPQGKMRNIHYWAQLTKILNADSSGAKKSDEKWRKVWSDMKNNTKKKAARIRRHATGTDGGPASRMKLTEYEERVLNIVNSQAATGIPEVVEVGFSQEDIQPFSASVYSEVLEAKENTFAKWSPPGTSPRAQPPQLSQDDIEPSTNSAQSYQDTSPIPKARLIPTPATARRNRRLLQTMPSLSRRKTRTQTQSELARQAFVNSDNEWRVFQQKCEEERLRLRKRELHQQDRWLDLFGQFLLLGNRILETLQ